MATAENAAEAPAGGGRYTRTFRKLVRGRNINETTLLATDYLNHFNEVVMLLDMVADMPDMIEEVREWQPKSYQDHFRDSVFSDKELAIEAYEHAPPESKVPFEETVAALNRLILDTVSELEGLAATGDHDRLRVAVSESSKQIQAQMDRINGIIHGQIVADVTETRLTMSQSDIDDLFP